MITYGVIYGRYSAGMGQTDQSIEGQLRDCYEYAKQNNITIIDTYIDRHISGTDFENRTEFNRLMKDCERGQFSAVIVWKIDRFGRDRQELALNKVKLKKHGVKLLYAKEHIPDGPEGIILESLLEGMAEYYSAELAQKVKRGLRESMLKGHALGANPMLGYKIVDKKYVVDPLTTPVVQEIFERYANGETAKSIYTDLNNREIRTAKGQPFKKNTLYTVLRNEKYIGVYRYGDIVVKNTVPAILDQVLFDRVQVRLNQNRHTRSRARCTAPEEFLLTGKLVCGYCGESVIGESGSSRNGSTYYYYKCATRKNRGGSCEKKTIRKEFLEDIIINFTVNDVLEPELIDFLSKKVIEIQNSDQRNLHLESLNKQLKEVKKGLANLLKAIEMGIITETTKDRMEELETRKEALQTEIAREEIKKPSLTEEQVKYWLMKFKAGDIQSMEFKLRVINTFINTVYLYNDYADIVYNFCDNDGSRVTLPIDLNAKKQEQLCSAVPAQVPATGTYPNIIYLSQDYFICRIAI